MLKSMTAFGRSVAEAADKNITVEIRSVNSRYFDCNVRLPRSFAVMEEKVKSYLQQNAVSRAKVEVSITVERHGTDIGAVDVDMALAAGYVDALRRMKEELSLDGEITVMGVASNRDLFAYTRPAEDLEAEWARILPVLEEAAADYRAMRESEGEKIERDLHEKVASIAAMVNEVEEISRTDVVGYRAKLEGRLREILGDAEILPDEGRLLTECAIFADKIAIDEEITRLRSHFDAFREICAATTPAGRKLDFLMQEMNRETNTIGSKANNARIARIVVDMKCELEKIREQIQNIE